MDVLSFGLLVFGCAVAVLAGLIKGMVGFGMPMILISGLSSVLPPDVALGWLILPTLVTNGWQALRQGVRAAWESIRRFRLFLVAGFVVMILSAQLVAIVPAKAMLWAIGLPITLYAGATLLGRPLRLPHPPGRKIEAGVGAVAGFFGGISGVWGPPTVALLTALDTEKTEQIRVQGVIYGAGAVVLMGAHLTSGVLNSDTMPASGLLVLPALLGMWIGFRIHDRIEQAAFRKLTLIVLLIAGLNLIRRAVFSV